MKVGNCVLSATTMHNIMKYVRKITIFWKVKTLFCVQRTADVSNFYCNLSIQVFSIWLFLLILQFLGESAWLTICKGNTDFQSRSASSAPCFHELKNIYTSSKNIASPGTYFNSPLSHWHYYIHLIGKISNLKLLSDREEFWFLFFSMSVFSIS